MVIKLSEVDRGSGHFFLQGPTDHWSMVADEVALNPEATADVHVTRSVNRYLVKVKCRTSYTTPCARCLRPVEKQIESSFELVLILERLSGKDLRSDDESLIFLSPGTPEYDIGEQVRESLLVEIPYRTVCSENCPGLCPRCGKDLNLGPCGCEREDSRIGLAALKDLLGSDQKT